MVPPVHHDLLCGSLVQACYGILKVPTGNWLCRTCALGVQPKCLLCPRRGGALKPTRSGTKWVHVSCALWIPEVSIVLIDWRLLVVFSKNLTSFYKKMYRSLLMLKTIAEVVWINVTFLRSGNLKKLWKQPVILLLKCSTSHKGRWNEICARKLK